MALPTERDVCLQERDSAKEWFSTETTGAWEGDPFNKLLAGMWQMPHKEVKLRVLDVVEPLEQRFYAQADKWEQETKFVSSISKRITHPSYQAILGMGKEPGMVTILLRDMQQNRRPWFWALSYITQENPINPADNGKMDQMISAWIEWGKKRKLL